MTAIPHVDRIDTLYVSIIEEKARALRGIIALRRLHRFCQRNARNRRRHHSGAGTDAAVSFFATGGPGNEPGGADSTDWNLCCDGLLPERVREDSRGGRGGSRFHARRLFRGAPGAARSIGLAPPGVRRSIALRRLFV